MWKQHVTCPRAAGKMSGVTGPSVVIGPREPREPREPGGEGGAGEPLHHCYHNHNRPVIWLS